MMQRNTNKFSFNAPNYNQLISSRILIKGSVSFNIYIWVSQVLRKILAGTGVETLPIKDTKQQAQTVYIHPWHKISEQSDWWTP